MQWPRLDLKVTMLFFKIAGAETGATKDLVEFHSNIWLILNGLEIFLHSRKLVFNARSEIGARDYNPLKT
ncbi:hypothetical protein CFII64_24159 [Pseudomonas sp. CFII64]|nr:hypothetical protein CFII64_24159 [Pseudomonas sp. CFII64]